MKRLLLSVLVFTAAVATLGWARQVDARIQRDLASRQSDLVASAADLNRVEIDLSALKDRNHQLKLELTDAWRNGTGPVTAGPAIPQSGDLSPEESEELLAALDFSWNSSSNYIVVSKQTLTNVFFRAVKDDKLTSAALGVLAISSAEQSQLEDLMSRLHGQYAAWLTTHVEKVPPPTNEVLRYELPLAPEFFAGISNAFVSGAVDILGPERGNLLLNYSTDWMHDHGMTVSRPAFFGVSVFSTYSPDPTGYVGHDYQYEVSETMSVGTLTNGNFHSGLIRPKEPIPTFIQPYFPGGWLQIAREEGLTLSKYNFPVTNVLK